MKNFKVLCPNGMFFDQNTKVGNGKILNEKQLCLIIKNLWKEEVGAKSFSEWAQTLNDSGNFEDKFSKFNALDNLSNCFELTINKQHIDIYGFFMDNLPFKN